MTSLFVLFALNLSFTHNFVITLASFSSLDTWKVDNLFHVLLITSNMRNGHSEWLEMASFLYTINNHIAWNSLNMLFLFFYSCFDVIWFKVDGGWTTWESWTSCTRSCESGTQLRVRNCSQPAPQNGGKFCPGQMREERACNTQACPGKSLLNPFAW